MFWNRNSSSNNKNDANATNVVNNGAAMNGTVYQSPANTVMTPMRRTSTPATFTYNNGYMTGNNNNSYAQSVAAMTNSSTYKLYYFPIRGTAEGSRMILNYAGVPFEDIRITNEAWPSWKSKMPQGTLPVLLVEGKRLSQSMAIASFLGHRFNLAGRSDWEQARVDEAVHTYRDFYEAVHDYLLIAGGMKQGNAKDILKNTVEPAAERYLSLFSHMVDRHNNQFIAGNKETYADFIISDFFFTLQGFAPKLFNKRQDLIAYTQRVQSLPQLQNYLRIRPKSAF